MQSSVLWEDTDVMCFGFMVGKVRPYICRCGLCCSTRNGCHLQSRAPGLRSPSKMSSAQHSPAQGRCTCIEERMNDSALQSRSGASDAQLHGAIESLQPLTWRWLCTSENYSRNISPRGHREKTCSRFCSFHQRDQHYHTCASLQPSYLGSGACMHAGVPLDPYRKLQGINRGVIRENCRSSSPVLVIWHGVHEVASRVAQDLVDGDDLSLDAIQEACLELVSPVQQAVSHRFGIYSYIKLVIYRANGNLLSMQCPWLTGIPCAASSLSSTRHLLLRRSCDVAR